MREARSWATIVASFLYAKNEMNVNVLIVLCLGLVVDAAKGDLLRDRDEIIPSAGRRARSCVIALETAANAIDDKPKPKDPRSDPLDPPFGASDIDRLRNSPLEAQLKYAARYALSRNLSLEFAELLDKSDDPRVDDMLRSFLAYLTAHSHRSFESNLEKRLADILNKRYQRGLRIPLESPTPGDLDLIPTLPDDPHVESFLMHLKTDPAAVLDSALTTRDPQIHEAVARILPRLKEGYRLNLALKLVADPSPQVRIEAIRALSTTSTSNPAINGVLKVRLLEERNPAIKDLIRLVIDRREAED